MELDPFFFFLWKRQNNIVVSCLSCKTVLPPVLCFCNLNLRSLSALHHNLNSLDWHPCFTGERQIWDLAQLFLRWAKLTSQKKKQKPHNARNLNLPGHSRKPVAAQASQNAAELFCPLAALLTWRQVHRAVWHPAESKGEEQRESRACPPLGVRALILRGLAETGAQKSFRERKKIKCSF